MEVMRDPVMASDGHTYERVAIERWLFRDGHLASPRTNAPLPTMDLIPNFALRMQIIQAAETARAEAVPLVPVANEP